VLLSRERTKKVDERYSEEIFKILIDKESEFLGEEQQRKWMRFRTKREEAPRIVIANVAEQCSFKGKIASSLTRLLRNKALQWLASEQTRPYPA
jgi:hypothetical protein